MTQDGNNNAFFPDTLSPGQLVIITGPMREGKSNLTVYLMEKAVDVHYNCYTNINFFEGDEEIEIAKKEGILDENRGYHKKDDNIHVVTKASELIKALYKTSKNITVLDEAQIYAGSSRGNAVIVRWFKEFITQIGKLRSSMILVTQVKSELAVMLKKKLPCHEIKVYKRSFYDRIADVYYVPPQAGDEAEEPQLVKSWKNLPPTKYPYDHEIPAMFEFDLNMEEFLLRISKLNSVEIRHGKMVDGMLVNAQTIVNDMLREMGKEETEGWLSTGEHGEKYGVHPDTSLRWAKAGRVPHYITPGGQYRLKDVPPNTE